MKCKVYLSDEGFGHLVRQRAVIEQLQNLCPELKTTVQTGSHADKARDLFSSASIIKKFNNIHWARKSDGSPDLLGISEFFSDYQIRSEQFMEAESENIEEYDFVISDFVYEAFPVAKACNVPVFGIAHFTWDWFFSKMYPVPVAYSILEQMQNHAKMSDRVYFPPFTPEEILNFYGSKALQVPLIIGDSRPAKTEFPEDKFTVLIMDSGASVLSQHMSKAIEQIASIDSMHFLVAEKYALEADNVTAIPQDEFFSDYIGKVDLVVTRGGFNTISECIAYRTPVLLLGESSNPEIEKNLLAIKSQQLGSFVSLETFVNDLDVFLNSFIDHEYVQIKKRMDSHNYQKNGAEVIAKDILKVLEDR